MHREVKHFYEFGPYRLETSERILLRDGAFVPLTPKSFETLLALVESSGRILDKEELLGKIWPDTFVEEVSLAKKISLLRKTLGEDVAHHYIETIPRRGYRFVADVREFQQDGADAGLSPRGTEKKESPIQELSITRTGLETASQPSATLNSSNQTILRFLRPGRQLVLLGLLVLVLVVSFVTWQVSVRRAARIVTPSLKAFPLTSFQGRESQAAFSPSGNQIAFVWDGPQGDNSDIYVKLLGDETPLRLTSTPETDSKPAWSPDGNSIAFLRQSTESSAFYLIPALGGPERKLADVFPYGVPSAGNTPYFSPDGKYLAVPDKSSAADPMSIFLLSVETGEKRKLTSPAAGTGDHYPAFSPDGKMLAFVRIATWSTSDLYVLPLSGGEPRRLTFDSLSISGLSWTADTREIVFASRREGSTIQLWRIPASGGIPKRVETVGKDVMSPALSRQGDRLAYTLALDDMNIGRIELDSTGRGKPATELIASTFFDHGPDYSPDGRKIVFGSGRSGGDGIWICGSDGSAPRLLIDRGPYVTGSPRWSPDGRWIAYDSRSNTPGSVGNPDIYLISAHGGQPRRLTDDPAEDVAPSWSRDGRWVYFGSTRSGKMQLWKLPVEQGPAVQITRQGGFEGSESPDSKYLYYTRGRGIPGIWRVPAEGGEEILLTGHHRAGLLRYWRVAGHGIYFVTATGPSQSLEFFSFATGRITEVTRLAKKPRLHLPGLAVSPDERFLLYVQEDQSGSDLMMAEGFR